LVELARVLYGSQNYELDGPNSDRDYKVVLCPEFSELYEGRMCKRNEGEHLTGIDMRRLHGLLMNGNPNAVELLYSVEAEVEDEDFGRYLNCARMMYEGGYVAAVWKTFYAALYGMAMAGIDHNVVSPKTVARAFYMLELAKWIGKSGFVIDEATYRGDAPAFHRLARNIRFGHDLQMKEAVLHGIAEDVKRGFEDCKAEFQNWADADCEGEHWKSVVAGMDKMARAIVMKRVYGEIVRRLG
jgi:hypothetical protein